ISGDGNLDVNGNYDGIFSDGELTLSASGTISANGENCGIYSYGSINFTYDSNVVVAYGENEAFGGIAWDAGSGAKLIVPKEFSVCGTESYGIDEETVSLNNAYVNDVDGCIMDAENVARSVRIQGHDLYITKNGEAAVNNSDYRWEGRTLYIRVNSLAVSGTTDRDVIVAEDSVDNVTFCDLSVNYSHEMYVGSDINIILSGSNVLNFTGGCDGLSFGGDSQISGRGNLVVTGAERSICGKRNVLIRSNGSIVLNGGKEGIHAEGYVFFSETVGKVLAYGSEAAITWGADSGNGMSVPDKLNIQGSADINAEESEITDRVTYLTEDKCVKVGEDSAKAVLITRAVDGIHDLFVKNDYREAILGTDYVWYDNELFIQKSGLTVYGSTEKEHILVASSVDNLTIKNLYITVNENDSSAIHFGGDCELILEGNNCLSNLAMTNGCCIDFVRSGVISGDGDLIITANDTGINSIDNLTVKATGELNISGAKHGISVSVGGVEFTNDVTDILVYGEANDFGAIGWATNIGFGTHLSVKGSREFYVDAEEITGNVTINADAKKLETATFTAKSIKILQHGLTVTKDGLEPEFGVDCIWENDKLIIKKSGLTVSGETDKEYIYVENTAEDLTLDNVNISAPCDAVNFMGSSELILKGNNVINSSGSNIYSHYRGIIFNKNGIISGEGGLTVNAKDEAIYCMQLLTVSASGSILFDGYIGISAEDGVIFEDTVTNAVIYGNNDFYGAMYWSIDRGGTLYAPTGFYVCAAVDYKADEKNITHVATYASYDRCVKDGTSIARSVVVSRHGLTVTKNGVPAVQGKDYFWKASDPTVLIIKTNGLTVSGTTTRESISVNDGVNGITIENLNISVLGKVSVDFNGIGKLTLKGDNVLSSFENSDGIFFYRDGEITGDGNLTVYGASYGIFANGVLTISASGNIIAKGDASSAVNGVKGIIITDDVTKILAYSLTYGKPAVEWEYSFGGSLSVAESVNVYGGDVWCAEEYEITKPVEHGAECEAVKLGTSPAISVKFCKGGPYYGHYIHVTTASGEAVAGTDYEWDKEDTNKLIIKNSGLTVSGVSENEYIVVEESVENLTINNLDITVSDTAAIEIASN
ncbi:MAG: hypothetical protein KBS44_01950, partial [Clostridiales bacterium]|nr:hypothetical protein [Candidatus Coliplasma equi]